MKSIDIKTLERANFGSWVKINSEFAKFFRECLSSKDNRVLAYQVFADANPSTIENLCDKELISLLGKANTQRNDWSGHAGITSDSIYADHVNMIHEQLLKAREIIGDTFEDIRLVRSITSKKSSGIYTNTVELITGSNSMFKKDTIHSDSDVLDDTQLYLHIGTSNATVELIPLLVMDSSPSSDKNACYFYSKTTGGSTKYVSYHYMETPETIRPGEQAFTSTKDAICALQEK